MIRLFWGRFSLPLASFLLLSIGVLSSSSVASDALFARSQSEIERLWSGVLGCAERSESFTPRNHFEDAEDANGGVVPTGTTSDYSQCGKRALRDTGSRILVDTIEDAVRSGGVALFDRNFRLDSSIGWVFGENVTGEVDAVVPLWSENKRALFVQPGMIFWTGIEEQERFDGNLGLVYRTGLPGNAIGGASLFYDHDFERGHTRAGLGADIQSGFLHGSANYYQPLSDEQEGRAGYIEEAIRGMDARLVYERRKIRLSGNLGYWRYEGEDTEEGSWELSYGLDAGVRVLKGVFIEGRYEKHEDASIGGRFDLGVAFKFSLPGFEGASYSDGSMSSNLWKPVEREKRILYEERLALPQVRLTATTANVGEPMMEDETETATIEAELGKPLDEDVLLHIMVMETSTAVLGEDFTYGHKVYEMNEETGEQSAPEEEAVFCPDVQEEVCEVMVPAGVTRFDIEAKIHMTTDTDREIAEFIDFQVEVPEEYVHLLRSSGVTRLTINGHGNEIGFAGGAETSLAEDNETDGIEISVNINKPSPAPFTLNVATDGTAVEGEDYRISTRSLAVPANASSASLMLHSINDRDPEGNETIILTLSDSGNLPVGWVITDGEHEIILTNDDLGIFFTSATPRRVEEPATGSEEVTVEVGVSQAPPVDINVRVTVDGGGPPGQAALGGSMDYTFVEGDGDVTFTPDDHANQTFTFSVRSDTVIEPDEFIILTLADMGTQTARENAGFLLGSPHIITIPANDNLIQFTEITGQGALGEADGTRTRDVRVSMMNTPFPSNTNIRINRGGTATEGEDYNITIASPATASYAPGVLTIPANETQIDLTVTVIDDPADDWEDETIDLTLEDMDGSTPLGWAIDASKSTEMLTIIDNDQGVSFSSNRVTQTREEANAVFLRTNINFSSLLTESVTIPLTITGDRDAFEIDAFDRAPVALQNDAIPVPSNVNSIQLRIKPIEDSDDLDDLITIAIDGDNLPAGYGVGEENTWEITIIDKDKRTVSFDGASVAVSEDSGSANVELEIWPPLDQDVTIPLTISGDADAYSITASAPASAMVSNGMVNFIHSEDSGSVTLSLTATQDTDRFDETIVLTIDEGNLPAGYKISGDRKSWTFRVVDDDKRIVKLTDSNSALGEGRTLTTRLEISEALAEDVMIPLKVTGDTDSYLLSVSAPASASLSDNMVHFVQSDAVTPSVTLRLYAREEVNNRDEIVTIAIDEDNLPAGYGVDENNNSWRIAITDDDIRAVSLRHITTGRLEQVRLIEGETWNNTQVQISPALEAGQNPVIPLKITGDANAYYRLFAHAPEGAGVDTDHKVYFSQAADADSVTLSFRARTDFDASEDLILVAIDEENLPDGFYLGEPNVWRVRLVENQRPTVTLFPFVGPRLRPDYGGVVNLFPRVGDVIDLRLRRSPAAPMLVWSKHDAPNSYFRIFHCGGSCSGYDYVHLDDHPRGSGGDRVYIHPGRINASEINYRFTMAKAGLYSVWIKTLPNERVGFGETRQVLFHISN